MQSFDRLFTILSHPRQSNGKNQSVDRLTILKGSPNLAPDKIPQGIAVRGNGKPPPSDPVGIALFDPLRIGIFRHQNPGQEFD